MRMTRREALIYIGMWAVVFLLAGIVLVLAPHTPTVETYP